MPTESNVDVEAIREDVSLIKDAMGLGERYPSRIRDWLVFGGLVTVAAAISQYVHLRAYPGFWHPVVWFVVLGGGSVLAFHGAGERTQRKTAVPSIPVQFAAPFLAFLPIHLAVFPFLGDVGYRRGSIIGLGVALALLGVAYLGTGNALRAYRIRRRDRYVFFAGGLWMVGLGAVLPHSAFLVDWGYAAFGGLYLVYALASYAVLSRT